MCCVSLMKKALVTPSVMVKRASLEAHVVTSRSESSTSSLFYLWFMARCDRKKDRVSAQNICVEDDFVDGFQITVQGDEGVFHFFKLQ